MGVGSLRAPGYWGWDEAVSRQFQIREGQRLEIRGEAFNVTNSVRLAAPVVNINTSQFGRITGSVGGPRIMQFALKYVF